jgi:hypothetical protein
LNFEQFSPPYDNLVQPYQKAKMISHPLPMACDYPSNQHKGMNGFLIWRAFFPCGIPLPISKRSAGGACGISISAFPAIHLLQIKSSQINNRPPFIPFHMRMPYILPT